MTLRNLLTATMLAVLAVGASALLVRVVTWS